LPFDIYINAAQTRVDLDASIQAEWSALGLVGTPQIFKDITFLNVQS
jgi:hypothetical protein